jgi:hypothetical protein
MKTIFLLLLLFPLPCLAERSMDLDGAYLYSSLQDEGASTFSMLSKSGLMARVDAAIGIRSWDLVVSDEMDQMNLLAPSSKTVTGTKLQTNNLGVGLRWKTPAVWTRLSYNTNDAL